MTAPTIAPEVAAAARRRADEASAESLVRAREVYPERFAPDGTPLMRYEGSSWFDRLNSWRRAHGIPEVERTRELHPQPTPPTPRNTYSDERTEIPM